MRHLLFWILCFTISTVLASPKVSVVTRETEFDGCHLKISDPYKGSLRLTTDGAPPLAVYTATFNPKVRHSVDEVSILFRCKTTIGEKAFTNIGIAHENGEFSLAPDKNDPGNLANQKVYKVHGTDVEGGAITYDQTTGEENGRVQGLGFCVTNQKQILCGHSEAVAYVAYPKASSLPQVLKLLESIEFLEPNATSP